uniref:Uncharacterized protein n=1 Tax=Rhizophora mucronata TaxID=61149 RepID=A0A2P2MCP9_RHIMU
MIRFSGVFFVLFFLLSVYTVYWLVLIC